MLWERLPLWLRIGFAVFSAIMTILGIPLVGEDVADWAAWLSFVGSTVGGYVFPLLGLLGLVTFIGLQVSEVRARRRNQMVIADIRHREGCPRNAARMETYPKVRERDGIEVMVGHCIDCGATAYRHGDRATLGDPSPEREEWKPEARSPIERLRAALSEAIDLRAEINEAEPSQWSYGRNDPLLSWARDTWELIREHFTEYADEFWGPELTGLRSDYFATAYSLECRDLNRDGRSGYLERRIYLLKRIAREAGR